MRAPDLFLFVSHVGEDQSAAVELVRELERRDVSCWIASRDADPGRPRTDQIADAIENCRAVLLIFSDRGNDADGIRSEVTIAGDAGKVIVPVRIESQGSKRGPRIRVSDLHRIDAFVSRERTIDELVNAPQPLPKCNRLPPTRSFHQPTRLRYPLPHSPKPYHVLPSVPLRQHRCLLQEARVPPRTVRGAVARWL